MKQLIMKLKHNQDFDFVDNAYAVLEVDDRLEKMLKEYSELIKGKDSVHCLTICCDADYELQMEFEETEVHQLYFSGTGLFWLYGALVRSSAIFKNSK